MDVEEDLLVAANSDSNNSGRPPVIFTFSHFRCRPNKDADSFNPHGFESPNVGDVKFVYHPKSRRAQRILSAADFQAEEDNIPIPSQPSSTCPWHPFPSRLDFEVAEVMLHAGMNARLVDRTIQLFKRAKAHAHPDDDFSLKDHAHVRKLWDQAGERATRVR